MTSTPNDKAKRAKPAKMGHLMTMEARHKKWRKFDGNSRGYLKDKTNRHSAHLEDHDGKLENHEKRITELEKRKPQVMVSSVAVQASPPPQPARVVTVRSAAPAQARPAVQEPNQPARERNFNAVIVGFVLALVALALVLWAPEVAQVFRH